MPFSKTIRLNLGTGESVCSEIQNPKGAGDYFAVITSLNESAHVYGCVYLASKEALQELKDLEDALALAHQDNAILHRQYENMLSDKNKEIDDLQDQINELEERGSGS